METIENIAADQNYCEMTKMFSNDELKSWTVHQAFTQSYEYSSSPEGAASTASKTIVSERKRRKKLNDKLLELRGAVPKISKLDKASTLKDAIVYIQDLQEQERRLQAEIMELESKSLKKDPGFDFEQELPVLLRPKKTRYDQIYDHRAPISYPIKVHELRVNSMGETTLLVSLTCSKARDAMIKICEIFESMKLKIISANVAIVSGMVKKTVLIEADMEEKDNLIIKIERAFSAVSDPDSHLSMQSK